MVEELQVLEELEELQVTNMDFAHAVARHAAHIDPITFGSLCVACNAMDLMPPEAFGGLTKLCHFLSKRSRAALDDIKGSVRSLVYSVKTRCTVFELFSLSFTYRCHDMTFSVDDAKELVDLCQIAPFQCSELFLHDSFDENIVLRYSCVRCGFIVQFKVDCATSDSSNNSSNNELQVTCDLPERREECCADCGACLSSFSALHGSACFARTTALLRRMLGEHTKYALQYGSQPANAIPQRQRNRDLSDTYCAALDRLLPLPRQALGRLGTAVTGALSEWMVEVLHACGSTRPECIVLEVQCACLKADAYYHQQWGLATGMHHTHTQVAWCVDETMTASDQRFGLTIDGTLYEFVADRACPNTVYFTRDCCREDAAEDELAGKLLLACGWIFGMPTVVKTVNDKRDSRDSRDSHKFSTQLLRKWIHPVSENAVKIGLQ